jgi:uncharacterized membrane protein YbhN (UPF0104 family)
VDALKDTLALAAGALVNADPWWVAVAVALYLLSITASGARWRVLIHALGGAIPLWASSLAVLAGIFVNNVTPTGRLGGEACRVAITRMRGRLNLPLATLAVLCDRVSDGPVVALMALFALPALGPLVAARWRTAIITTGVGLLIAVVVGGWFRHQLRGMVTAWRRQYKDLRLSRMTLAKVGVYSFFVWFEDVLRLMAVAAACGVWLTPPQAAALATLVVLGGFAPTVGGLGAVEGGLVAGLALFGVPLETALAITAIERLISYAMSTVLGGITVFALGGRSLLKMSLGRT